MEGDRTMCKTIYEKSRNPLCVQLDMESAEIIVVEFSVPQSQSAMRAIRYGASYCGSNNLPTHSRNPLCVQLDMEQHAKCNLHVPKKSRNPLCVQLDMELAGKEPSGKKKPCRNPLCVQLDMEK